MKDFSIVIPVYNAANSLVSLVNNLHELFTEKKAVFEIILVNDNSQDDSWQIINSLKKEYPHSIIGIHLSRNYGQQNATLCGIVQSKGQWVVTMDDDWEHLPNDIELLLEHAIKNHFDVVYGVIPRMRYSLHRRLLTFIFKKIQKWKDVNSGRGSSFRIMNRDMVVHLRQAVHGFVVLDEIFRWHTDRIGFVSLSNYPSRKLAGTSYNIRHLLKLGINVLIYTSSVPLRFITVLGLLSSVINILIAMYYAYRKIFHQVSVPGYTSLIISIFLTSSVILYCIGIIGEYLDKIYRIQKREPLYTIRKII